MIQRRWSVIGLVACYVATPCPVASAQATPTLDLPAELRSHFDKLKKGEDRTAAVNALAARDDAAPYLRHELAAATEQAHKRDLAAALREIDTRACERNRKRMAWWAATRRFDMCAELIVACPTDNEAVGLVDLVLPEIHAVATEAAERSGVHFERVPGVSLPQGFGRLPRFTQLSGEEVSVSPRYVSAGHTLLRAGTCKLDSNEMNAWFAAVRSGVQYRGELSHEWHRSTVLVNESLSLRALSSSVVVCDGDIDLRDLWKDSSVIIANGDIRADKQSIGVSRCALCAAGDILVAGGKDSQFHAGGKVAVAPSARAKEKQKSLPFGVKFLDPARDFGVELVARDGVRVTGIAPGSPFAGQGVEVGDVITRVDGVNTESVGAFRRQLRRGILRESVVLDITRGSKRLARVVFLDGIPAPVAPLPRVKP